MNISSINYHSPEFKHFGEAEQNGQPYSKKQKLIIAGMSAVGTAASCAILAKRAGYSLNPSKIFNLKNIKNSYLAKVKYHDEQVIPIGVGSILGGLAGGYMVDKDPNARKEKRREALMQVGNVSIPILTVDFLSEKLGKYGKVAKTCGAVAGIFAGVYLANIIMNRVNNFIFNKKEGRDMKLTDFSAHVDDAVVAASYVSSSPIVDKIERIIPIVLMIPGNEVGNKK